MPIEPGFPYSFDKKYRYFQPSSIKIHAFNHYKLSARAPGGVVCFQVCARTWSSGCQLYDDHGLSWFYPLRGLISIFPLILVGKALWVISRQDLLLERLSSPSDSFALRRSLNKFYLLSEPYVMASRHRNVITRVIDKLGNAKQWVQEPTRSRISNNKYVKMKQFGHFLFQSLYHFINQIQRVPYSIWTESRLNRGEFASGIFSNFDVSNKWQCLSALM